MEKVNFAKIEEALRRGIEKFQQEQLLGQTPSKKGVNVAKKRAGILIFLKAWAKRIPKDEVYKPLVKRIRDLDTTFSEEEWVVLEALKDQILATMHSGRKAPPSDEDIIEMEKQRSEKKRFNIPERWLPLD